MNYLKNIKPAFKLDTRKRKETFVYGKKAKKILNWI